MVVLATTLSAVSVVALGVVDSLGVWGLNFMGRAVVLDVATVAVTVLVVVLAIPVGVVVVLVENLSVVGDVSDSWRYYSWDAF